MASPVISVDSTGGSSDTTASGAGPATAISGSTGRTRNTASQLHFGMFGATDDFSGVAVDGSAVLYMAIATAGQRNFSSIAATKNTRQTGTDAAITSAAAILVVGSTTGWTAGDVIKVTGAGAASADLYSTILSVDSGIQATLNDNAGTTVASAAWENPKQFTLTASQGVNTGTTNTAWAVGGKRATIGGTNSRKLFDNNSGNGDALPGWTVQMQSGHAETLTSTISFRRSGDTTTGPISVNGTGATRPILTCNNDSKTFDVRGDSWHFAFLEFQNTAAGKTASYAIAFNSGVSGVALVCKNIRVMHATNKHWRGISIGPMGMAYDCEVGNTSSHGMMVDGGQLVNNWIYTTGGHSILAGSLLVVQSATVIKGNICYNPTGDCIHLSCTGTTNIRGGILIEENVLDTASSDGIEVDTTPANVQGYFGLTCINNLITNCGGYVFNFSGASQADISLLAGGAIFLGNCYYNVTSGVSNLSPFTSDILLIGNPAYGAASTGNFMAGTAVKAKGYPLGGTLAVGTGSTTYSYVDPGIQRQEAGGGGGMMVPTENFGMDSVQIGA